MPSRNPSKSSSSSGTIYQLKITLKGSRPPIWRRVQVLSTITLGQLHEIIQTSMGWTDSHLHQFKILGREYGRPQPEFDFYVLDESKTKLSQVVAGEKFKFVYEYDFGDGWDHDVLVEKVLPRLPDAQYPVCLTGKRACPPEDSGGVWGYAELLQTVQDPSSPDYEEQREWLGEDFDSEAFDLDDVNEALESL
jgi:Plasmid pRiA4b ORF-3-like protein